MTSLLRWGFWQTLRGRLLGVAVLVEALMLVLLVSNSLRLLNDHMGRQTLEHSEQLGPVLVAALVAPLAQSDYATVQAVLDESRRSKGLDYLAVQDSSGVRVAASGWASDQPLPEPDDAPAVDSTEASPRYDVVRAIDLAGQPLGTLHFGIDLSAIVEGRRQLFVQGVVIAAGELALSTLLLGLLWMLLTRQLTQITQAARQVASGSLDAPRMPQGDDDVGRLGAAFNVMSHAVAERLQQVSQARDEATRLAGSLALEHAQLQAAKEAADAANVAKSQFLATMSHEIRTPLNGVLGMAQLLMKPQLPEERRREYARTILSSGQTLLALLNDILDLAKVESGKLELEPVVFSPSDLVRESLTLYGPAARDRMLRLRAGELLPPSTRFVADSQRLRQMLANLIGNALKFTREGEIVVSVRELPGAPTCCGLEFSVSDTGPGIPEDRLPLLFRPFSQLDASSTRQFGGSGLGLSIVRRLAERMDGEAGVESAPGAGSRFWFRVRAEPVAEDAAGAGGTAPSGLDDGLPSLHGHLLVVEDDPVNLEVIQAMVETLGLSCDGVGDGQQALQRVQHGGRYDLILMDLMMPGIDGLETTRRLHAWQQAQGRARSVVLAVTANAFESTRQQVLQAGMSGLVSKPIDFTTLGATLAQHLPAAASASMAAAPDQSVLTGDELCRRIDTLLPRLEGRRLDALARFGELRQAARGSRWAAALEAMRPDLETLAFDAVARRLRELRTAACPPAHAGDDSGAGATGGPAGPDPG